MMNVEIGKKVKLVLKNGYCYNGKVQFVNEKDIVINDKFNNEVVISKEGILLLEFSNDRIENLEKDVEALKTSLDLVLAPDKEAD